MNNPDMYIVNQSTGEKKSVGKAFDVIPGLKSHREAQMSRKCPFCKKQLQGIREEFSDGLSFKEFGISGLCQSCQDDFFGKED